MKKGWEVKKLGEFCNLMTGGTPSRSKPEYFINGKIKWLVSGDIHKTEIFDCDGRITAEGMENSNAKYLPVNSVIIALNGQGKTRGTVAILRTKATCNQSLVSISPKNVKESLPEYIFCNLHGRYEEIRRITGDDGNDRRGLNMPLIRNIEIPLPPLPEQKRIVDILDKAFAAISTAKENAEKNLQNARELFESYLQGVFANPGDGWEEKSLEEIGKTQTGTTPKTSDEENYGNYIPFIKPADIDIYGDGRIQCRDEGLSEQGLKNGRKMKKNSILMVCIGASIGKVGYVNRDVSCNQQINSLTVKKGFCPKFFYYALSTKGFFEQVIKNSAQATLPIINKGKWQKLSISYPFAKEEQESIVAKLDTLSAETKKLEAIYQQKIADLDELKKTVLQKAFSGQLTAGESTQSVSVAIPFPQTLPNISTTDLHAGVLAMACELHEKNNKLKYFAHVKAEKIAHMVEAWLGIDLGRKPVKNAAGPNDFPHLLKVEHRARTANYFDFKRVAGGAYQVHKLRGFERLIDKTRILLGQRLADVERLLQWMLPMTMKQAMIVATVYAAWNNLLLDGREPTNEDIVREAREDWHPDKLKIEREKFFKAIGWLREQGVVPEGKGQRVVKKAE